MAAMNQIPELNDREAHILHAVVHTYITTAEPVGSRTVAKRGGFDLSAATIRNVMADLEELGFLQQLHTSSGRVPTDKGYRYYVKHLMKVQELTLDERQQIKQELERRINDADDVLRHTSHLLALVSHQAGIAESPREAAARVRQIELFTMGERRAAVMIVDNFGRVKSMTVELTEALAPEEVHILRRFLNDHLRDAEVDYLASVVEKKLRGFFDDQRKIAEKALQLLKLIPAHRPSVLFLEGATQLFQQPEFQDISRAQEVFGLLDAHDRVIELMRTSVIENQPVFGSVVINSESADGKLQGISVVAAPYEIDGRPVGTIGVLGPQRMPYSKLTALVNYTSTMVGKLLTKLAQ